MTHHRNVNTLQETANKVRKEILEIIGRSRSAHIGSSFSIVEILVALYFECLRLPLKEWKDGGRDRFILSKGHGSPALYVTLANRGILSKEMLAGFACNGGLLEQHPTKNPAIGIEVSTGSLGHGLSIGCGMALAGKHDKREDKVFVLLSDGETNEGSVWEAAMLSAQHKLDNLIAIVDYNRMQALGKTEEVINLDPFPEKWRSFGWAVREVDGHNLEQLVDVFQKTPFEMHKPSAVIAHTVKGKGVCFMEDELLWHYRCPEEDEYKKALCEIEKYENRVRQSPRKTSR